MDWVMTSTPKKISHRQQQTNVNKNLVLSRNLLKDFPIENTQHPNFLSCNEFISSLRKTPQNLEFSKPFSQLEEAGIYVSKSFENSHRKAIKRDISICSPSFKNSGLKKFSSRNEDEQYVFKPINSPRLSQHEESKLLEPSTLLPVARPGCSSQLSVSSARSSCHQVSDPCHSRTFLSPERRKSASGKLQDIPIDKCSLNRWESHVPNEFLFDQPHISASVKSKFSRRPLDGEVLNSEGVLQSLHEQGHTSSHILNAGKNCDNTTPLSSALKVKNVLDKDIQREENFNSPKRNAVVTFCDSQEYSTKPLNISSGQKLDRTFATFSPGNAEIQKWRPTKVSLPFKSERTFTEELEPTVNLLKGSTTSMTPHDMQRNVNFGVTDFGLSKSLPVYLSNKCMAKPREMPALTKQVRDQLYNSIDPGHFTTKMTNRISMLEEMQCKEMKKIYNRDEMDSNKALHRLEHSIRLISLLYHTDYQTRNHIIMLARCFKRWQVNAKKVKLGRQLEAYQANLAYGFYRSTILHQSFSHWITLYKKRSDITQALVLHRRHLLKKALKALTWAVCQGRREAEAVSFRQEKLIVRHTFNKWRERCERRQDLRRQIELQTWKRDSLLLEKCNQFQSKVNSCAAKKAFNLWRTICDTKRKTRVARTHYRYRSLKVSFHNWCLFIAESKVKVLQNSLAQVTLDRQLKTRWFYKWCEVFYHRKQALFYDRRRQLKRYWGHWKKVLPLHRASVQRLTSIAVQFRRHSLLYNPLQIWNNALLEKKTKSVCHLKILQQSIRICEKQEKYVCLSLAFDVWVKELAVRNWERFAVTVYSSSCKRWAFMLWREKLNEKNLIPLEKETKAKLDHHQLNKAFKTWVQRHIQKQQESLYTKIFTGNPELESKRHIFTRWRVVTQQSIAIEPLQDRIKRRQLLNIFDGWRSVVIREQLLKAYCEYQTRQLLVRRFLWWRVRYLSSVQTKECEKISAMSTQKLFFHRWLNSYQMMKNRTRFQTQSLLWKYFSRWKIRFEVTTQQAAVKKNIQRCTLLSECFKRLKVYTAKRKLKTELSSQCKALRRYQLLRRAFTTFKYSVLERQLPQIPCEIKQFSFTADFPLLCVGNRLKESIRRKRLTNAWKKWLIQYIQNTATKLFREKKLCHRYFHLWYSNTCKQTRVCLQIADSTFNNQRLKQTFVKWNLSMRRRQEHRFKLQQCLYKVNMRTAIGAWSKWRKLYQWYHAKNLEKLSIKRKIFVAWKAWTRECIDRRLRCRAFKRAVKERTMHVSFSRWKHFHVAVKLGVSYEEGLIMSRAYGSWLKLSIHLRMIDRLCHVFILTHEQAVLWRSLMLWKDCVHWNKILEETGDVFKHQRNASLKKVYLTKWKKRYLKRSAWNHYSSGLVKKSFGVWKAWMDTPI